MIFILDHNNKTFRNPAILCKVGSGTVRPFTAGTSNTSQSKDSLPPTPSKAWASGSHSPQVMHVKHSIQDQN